MLGRNNIINGGTMSDTNKVIYINYCDSINESKVKAIMGALSEIINNEKPDTIYFLFSSSGGLVEPGIVLHNFLRALPVELIMHNTGSIDSIANVIFLAGKIRYSAVHSSFLFHGVNWNFAANTAMPRHQMSEVLSSIDASEAKIAGIITERTKLTTEETRSLFAQGESKDAQFALSKGIVSKIINPEIPKGVPILSFNIPN
jgi:ATP-dependent Clp protease, protease subunit